MARARALASEPELLARMERGVPRQRRLAGTVLLLAGLPLMTLLLTQARHDLALSSIVLLFLLAVVVLALVGGVVVGVSSAIVAAWLINYFFVNPLHSFHIAKRDEEIALIVFVAVGAAVSILVEMAGRRLGQAARASAQAATLSGLAGAAVDTEQSLPDLLESARVTLGMESVDLESRAAGTEVWRLVERAGTEVPVPAPVRFEQAAGPRLRLVGRGPAPLAQDHAVAVAFAAAARAAHDAARSAQQAREAHAQGRDELQQTALLAAVGSDLRAPLAALRAASRGLRQADEAGSETARTDLLATIEAATDRLDALVRDLWDADRLEEGNLSVERTPVALDEVVAVAIRAVPGAADGVVVEMAEDMPPVLGDRGLIARVLTNAIEHALRHADRKPVMLTAEAVSASARLAITGHVKATPPGQPEPDPGVGLAVSHRFTEAMGGAIVTDRSHADELTIRVRLPLVRERPSR